MKPHFLALVILSGTPADLPGQVVRITEIMVQNTGGIRDEDSTRQPWIELWNPNASAKVALTTASGTAMKLDNGSVTWQMPDLEIMPDERIVVWASGKNRAVLTAPLHANFTLPASGAVVLRKTSDNTIVSRLNYGPQTADVSFGRDEWDTATTATVTGTYTNPTPGERNNYSGPGVAGNVLISPGSRAFDGTLSVAISPVQPDPGAVIRYTVNGTVPIPSSSRYLAPISVSATQLVRARAFKTGLLPGETETMGYLQLKPAGTVPADHTLNFSSAIPLVAITNFNGGTPPDTGDQSGFLWVWEPAPPDNRARFTNPPVLATRIVMDRRGSSTLTNPKHNLNVEFRKARDDDSESGALLGMPAESDWVFHAPYRWDRSLVHNPLVYEMSRRMGRYAARTRMAEVFIDTNGGYLSFSGGAGGDYFGVYNVMEKIRRGGDRVDIRKLDTYDHDAVAVSGGYIFKVDRLDPGDTGFTAGGEARSFYYPNESLIKSPQRDPQEQYLTNYLNRTGTTLQSTTWNHPVTGYAAWLDVPSCIDHHLLNVWSFNVDALRLSGFWHKERGGKLAAGPVWDFDRALDSDDSRDDNPAVWRAASAGDTDVFNYNWWNRLFADVDFYQKYIDRWQEMRRGAFSRSSIDALVDDLNNQIGTDAAGRDLTRWAQAKRNWSSPFTGTAYTGQPAEIQRIKDYLQQRANFMDSQWVGPVTAAVPQGQITPGTRVSLAGPASSAIYYTLNGADPRPAGGSGTVPGGVLTYSGPITLTGTTRLRARAYKASHTALTGPGNPSLVSKWSGLTNLLFSVDTPAAAGSLVVTEIHYHPANPEPSETTLNAFWGDNDFEFIELRNLTEGPLNLAGCQIDSGITFSFSGDNAVSIPAGGYLILAADPTAFAARYGSGGQVLGPFTGSLSNGGETLRLLAANAAAIQEITWSDAWHPATDGAGNSLVVYNARATSGYGDAANWRASAAPGGSPRTAEPNLPPEITLEQEAVTSLLTVNLTATVADDGQPEPGSGLALNWTKETGPGDVTFSAADQAATDVTFSARGKYSLRLTAADGVLENHRDITVWVRETFSQWQSRLGVPGSENTDADSDGLTNFAEFALSTNPLQAGPAATLATESGGISLILRRQAGPGAPVVTVQTSTSLQSFLPPEPGTYTETIMAGEDLTQTVRIHFPPPPASIRFLRLSISNP